MAFVIKSWHASNQADEKGRYVSIEGRQAGIIPWFLALVGIDPTVRMNVFAEKFTFEVGSLSGMTRRIIPLSKISSTFYGYSKPWKAALFLCMFGMLLGYSLEGGWGGLFFLLFFGGGVAYYWLNKVLTLAVVEDSSYSNLVEFKRSIIENQSIEEVQAEKVVVIINELIDRRLSSFQKQQALEYGLGKNCSNCQEVIQVDAGYCETCGAKAS